jgi:hypothetical protein
VTGAHHGRVPPPSREIVLENLEALLEAWPEPLQIVVREIQGLEGSIDAVACDAAGTPVVVGIADPDRELEQLSHLLAQRAWLTPRIRDWLQLNPQLPLRDGRPPRLLLLGMELAPATVAAAGEIAGTGLARVRMLETAAGLVVGLDPVSGPPSSPPEPAGAPASEPAEPPEAVASPAPDPRAAPGRSTFRTGLHALDLGGPRRPRSAPHGR